MATKRLVRSTTDRKIAGVAGGLADYFGIDSHLVRVLWVVAIVLPGGFGLLPYVVLWILLPEAPTPTSTSAIDIAEERFARGEITADELQRIKGDLA